jgi:protein phosphatase PTC7
LTSDGVTDNIFTYEILALANQCYLQKNIKDLAKKLAKIAAERGKKKEGVSPFSLKAKEHGISYEGGKLDDATAIVAEVETTKSKSS